MDFTTEIVKINWVKDLTVGQSFVNFKFSYGTFYEPLNVRAVFKVPNDDGSFDVYGTYYGKIAEHGAEMVEYNPDGAREASAHQMPAFWQSDQIVTLQLTEPVPIGRNYALIVESWPAGYSMFKTRAQSDNVMVQSTSTTTTTTTST